MEAAVVTARATTLHAARLKDAGLPFGREASGLRLRRTGAGPTPSGRAPFRLARRTSHRGIGPGRGPSPVDPSGACGGTTRGTPRSPTSPDATGRSP
ncbi:hypothetical protein [Streptomyces aurantiacus]|uniref:hypothetical protein n=1 Tax=Streptomyces aurantiacus TaxID=47760 RepID=UPI0027D87FD4|nr:hypothetical protein [Streptomyces aurantiacus]